MRTPSVRRAPRAAAHRRAAHRRAAHRRAAHRSAVLALLAAVALSLVVAAPAGARARRASDPPAAARELALQWYDITNQTVTAAAYPEPVTQSRTWSVSWLAGARALDSQRDPIARRAAFAQALHDTLVAQVPSQQSALDADLSATLSSLPSGPEEYAGIAAGKHAAATVLAERQGDGLDTASVDVPFTPPPPAPGVWQPTPPSYAPAVRAGEGHGRPFLLTADDQFDPGPPPSLTSSTYLSSLAEVRAYGSASNSLRTATQTDTALFWEPAINVQLVQIARAIVADPHRSLPWQARFVAAFNVITTDAQIAVYNAKFKYLFWRPVTAIRTGAVNPDPSWTPLFTTPRYPDWPSGHGGVAGAAQAVLTAFVGPYAPSPISVTSPTDPGSTHVYTNWRQVTREVIDARVWEGIHFRFSDVAGARLGRRLAAYELRRLDTIGL